MNGYWLFIPENRKCNTICQSDSDENVDQSLVGVQCLLVFKNVIALNLDKRKRYGIRFSARLLCTFGVIMVTPFNAQIEIGASLLEQEKSVL